VPDFNLFGFYRFVLSVMVGSYAAVRLGLFLWRWRLFGTEDSRSLGLLRRYAVVQLLRVRFFRFAGQLAVIAVLLAIFALLVDMHWRYNDLSGHG
jgi:hypothetical protein